MNIQKLISDQSVTRTLTSALQSSRDSMNKQKDESEEKGNRVPRGPFKMLLIPHCSLNTLQQALTFSIRKT